MVNSLIQPGAVLDGFVIGECVHHGGMAKLGRTLDRSLDEQGHNKHVDRLVALKHWASPLKLDESRLTVHVLEAIDPAAAILEFAAVNHVDHVVIGARQQAGMFARLGSVSSKVAFEAPCTVTVVRPSRPAARKDGHTPPII